MWHYVEGIRNWDSIWPDHAIRILPGPSSMWFDATGRRLPAPLFPGFDTLGTLDFLRHTGHDHSWFVTNRSLVGKEFTLSGSEQNPDLTGRSVRDVLRRPVTPVYPTVQAFLDHGADFVQADTIGELVAKMNALTDEGLITALILAGQKGVKIDLIVRGACTLPAQVPGLTDNIRVRSVIGRFLEHTRVFYFLAGAQEDLYLSSADWMNRNMLRRVELAWPVTDARLRQRIIDECLVAYLHDDRDAWTLQPDGQYQRAPRPLDGLGAQLALTRRYGSVGQSGAHRRNGGV
jgi:hypothetical protein